jgi:putative endonuclease
MPLLARLRQCWSAWFPPLTLGQRGERAAARFLRQHGFKIIARGQRDRVGEMDLVAVEGATVVFVEVKTRSSLQGGYPEEAVDREKQRRLTRLALGFLKRHDLLECSARFDVVAVTWPESGSRPTIEHFRGAFEAVGRRQMYS